MVFKLDPAINSPWHFYPKLLVFLVFMVPVEMVCHPSNPSQHWVAPELQRQVEDGGRDTREEL